MSNVSNMSEQEEEETKQAIAASLETAKEKSLQDDKEYQTMIDEYDESNKQSFIEDKGKCNDPEQFLQNRGSGNCLFESVAQIFFPFTINEDAYPLVDNAAILLRSLVAMFYKDVNDEAMNFINYVKFLRKIKS